MYRILICDDDKDIVEAVAICLTTDGYEAVKAYDGIQALEILRNEKIDLIIMDIMMPWMDGIQATARLRKDFAVPVILLSAKGEDMDKVLGLNVGADDYVTKPFSPLELMARVRSQLRRFNQLGAARPEETEKDEIYTTGGLMVDNTSKRVTVDGEEIRLTPIEFDILLFLIRNKGRVYSTSQIYEAVWDEEAVATENIIAVHIRHIREKIEISPKDPRYLKVVWGHGYKVEKL